MTPIIKHFDDFDAYKVTMLFYIFKNYPNSKTSWSFYNRGNHKFPKGFDQLLREQIDYFVNLKFTSEIETNFRKNFVKTDGTSLFTEDFYQFLRDFRFDPTQVHITQTGDVLDINIPLSDYSTNILWETMIMSVIVELYNMNNESRYTTDELNSRDIQKFEQFRKLGIKVIDMGSRRRSSFDNHDRVLNIAFSQFNDVFLGTSNMYFSRKYGVKGFGSIAHELNMALSTAYGPIESNYVLSKSWMELYGNNLLVALPDCYTTDVFLKVFDKELTEAYTGIRHDSHKFDQFTDKILNHYNSFNINSKEKTILYSDSIKSIEQLKEMNDYKNGEIKKLYGIGTWITNDIGSSPMNIVIKLTSAKMDHHYMEMSCVKISDDPGKYTYKDINALNLVLKQINEFK
jgi:nicotinate phosphoribosyltransferase